MLTPHRLKSFLSSFVYTPVYTCSHTLTSEHEPHHYDVDNMCFFFFKKKCNYSYTNIHIYIYIYIYEHWLAKRLQASCKGQLNDFFLTNKVFLDTFTLQAEIHEKSS